MLWLGSSHDDREQESIDKTIDRIEKSDMTKFQKGLAKFMAHGGCVPMGALFFSLMVYAYVTFTCAGFNTEYISPKYKSYERIQVEQVFRDHDGFRIYHTDNNSELKETHYDDWRATLDDKLPEDIPEEIREKFRDLPEEVTRSYVIFKDLDKDKEPYVDVLTYTIKPSNYSSSFDVTYIEIHLNKDGKLDPGIDEIGSKNPRYEKMKELGD